MGINHDHIKLSSSELSVLWGSYMNESLENCMISYFLKNVEDADIRTVLEDASNLAKRNMKAVTDLFKEEKIPVPLGFTEQDVNLNAKKLFTDSFMLYYIQIMGTLGLNLYSVSLSTSARKDIREFYTSCLTSSTDLFNRTSDVMQEKGLFIRPPFISYPTQIEFVEKQQFLAGWMGEQRPLTSIEVTSLFFNMYRNLLGYALITGFSQVAQSKEVRQFMVRGAEMAKQHSEVTSELLRQDDLLTPMSWDTMPLTSKEAPFSDKLMMFQIAAMNAAGIGFYGTSIGVAARKDLALAYSRLFLEVGEYAADGAKILIDNGWLEKPFSVPDRKELAEG